jgi:hypothetical protein
MVVSLCLFGCSTDNGIYRILYTSCYGLENYERTIVVNEGKLPVGFYDDLEFQFTGDCVPDGETAMQIASVLMESLQSNGKHLGLYPSDTVFYDIDNQLWIVSFGTYRDYPGYIVAFAIRKQNAEVVAIWAEE